MPIAMAILAVLSIWDYPAKQPMHEQLRAQLLVAIGNKDAATMVTLCDKGVELLPDDPTWRYNRACALAHFDKRRDEALDDLEQAIDLGFRDEAAIAADKDFSALAKETRFQELVEYAKEMKSRPLVMGPMATVAATGEFGEQIALGEHNLGWDFDLGVFTAAMELTTPKGASGGNYGDLYMNRDGKHSTLEPAECPGLTFVKLDAEGCQRGLDLNLPNMKFPYPTFGNCSMAFVFGPYWRSISRALMTTESRHLKRMVGLYLSNQLWMFPSNADTPPVGTNGDVFAAITPYWLTTAGRSFSDKPYLRAALLASRSLKPAVKAEIVKRGLLAPTIQTLIRKSLNGVNDEDGYLTARAHPTALPPNGVNTGRLERISSALTAKAIPPLTMVMVTMPPVKDNPSKLGELIYGTSCAWSFVLRANDTERTFYIRASGAEEYEFAQTHGSVAVKIERLQADVAKITFDRTGMNSTNRIDIAVVGRNDGTGWGAPSYVSFAVTDTEAAYSDPFFTPQPQPEQPPEPQPKQ